MSRNSKNEKRITIDSSKRKNDSGETHSSFTTELDPAFFHKAPTHIEFVDAKITYSMQVVGNTNNRFNIIKNNIAYEITVAPGDYRTTELLEVAIVDALSTYFTPGGITFDSDVDSFLVNNSARKQSSLLGTVYIFNSASEYTLDFNVNNSIGTLLGFGNGTFTGTYLAGNIAKNIEDAFAIYTNTSGTEHLNVNNTFQITNASDVVLLTFRGTFASTLSLRKYLEFVEDLINADANIIGAGLNLNFTYDDNTKRVTIFDTNNNIFGIDFVMNNTLYGSPHKVLGFEKQYYRGRYLYTGKKINASSDINSDDLFITSDLINGKDVGILVTNEVADSQDSSVLFNIPLLNPVLTTFEDVIDMYIEERGRQIVDIRSSNLAKGFRDGTWTAENVPSVRFTLRSSNGFHIDLRSRWSFRAIFHF